MDYILKSPNSTYNTFFTKVVTGLIALTNKFTMVDKIISIAHSPDTDDLFMFWAMINNKIDLKGYEFSYRSLPTHELNTSAINNEYDITAISVATYPLVYQNYLIMQTGASVGRGYGPVLVSKTKRTRQEISNAIIGVPGQNTTATLITKKLFPTARFFSYSIEPYETIFECIEKGEVDAAVLIHEGQLTYKKRGLNLIMEYGKWWDQNTTLPLPLGINVIKKDLGAEAITEICKIVKESIVYAKQNKKTVLEDLLEKELIEPKDFDEGNSLDKYLDMYVSDDTIFMDKSCKNAISTLLNMVDFSEIRYTPQ